MATKLSDYIMRARDPHHGFDTRTVKALSSIKDLYEEFDSMNKAIKESIKGLEKAQKNLDKVQKKIAANLNKAFPKPKP